MRNQDSAPAYTKHSRYTSIRTMAGSMTLLVCLISAATAWAEPAKPVPAGKPLPSPEDTPAETLGPVQMGMSQAALVKAVGEPATKETPIMWGADGCWHATWEYPKLGFSVDMSSNSEKGPTYVEHITAKEGCTYKTNKGIGLGATRQEVEKAYPKEGWDPDFSRDDQIVVGSIYGGIMFQFKDNKVIYLGIGAFAE